MNEVGIKAKKSTLEDLGLTRASKVFWNLTPSELVEQAILRDEGCLTDTGALAADTGEFTGRSPQDRFIVEDEKTADTVWWGKVNKKFDQDKFQQLYEKVINYLNERDIFVKDAFACAEPRFKLNIRVITQTAFQSMFAHNLFLRPGRDELADFIPEWTVIAAPGFKADPEIDGTRQSNFAIINFSKKMILIGGTAYTGEIKKGIFSVLNYILPHEKNVLSMHCSANVGEKGDTAIFFGLSGTGKTTLSADPNRKLIGDDEHGWTDHETFNFEGGCYAKVIDLSPEKEPEIYRAIKFGSLAENIRFKPKTRIPDYTNTTVTENTRAAYPIHYIDNAVLPSKGNIPENIFLLTADAFGVLPPISKLTKEQAMYHFLSGYTAKVAGTEAGIKDPVPAFSACFGEPFLPLPPTTYAEMLGEKVRKHNVNIWLVNTGWTGGPYGEGKRINLPWTRMIINNALEGKLNNVEYTQDPVFGLHMPVSCPGVPDEILSPRNTWKNPEAYDQKAAELANAFVDNFKKFDDFAGDDIKSAAPKI
jgi:phosphoenolpyruvate carboxykinase (ATP)